MDTKDITKEYIIKKYNIDSERKKIKKEDVIVINEYDYHSFNGKNISIFDNEIPLFDFFNIITNIVIENKPLWFESTYDDVLINFKKDYDYWWDSREIKQELHIKYFANVDETDDQVIKRLIKKEKNKIVREQRKVQAEKNKLEKEKAERKLYEELKKKFETTSL